MRGNSDSDKERLKRHLYGREVTRRLAGNATICVLPRTPRNSKIANASSRALGCWLSLGGVDRQGEPSCSLVTTRWPLTETDVDSSAETRPSMMFRPKSWTYGTALTKVLSPSSIAEVDGQSAHRRERKPMPSLVVVLRFKCLSCGKDSYERAALIVDRREPQAVKRAIDQRGQTRCQYCHAGVNPQTDMRVDFQEAM